MSVVRRWVASCLCAGVLAAAPAAAQGQQAPAKPAAGGASVAPAAVSVQTRQKLMGSLAKGAAYLKQQQHADGTWENHPGVTGMAIVALLRQPGVPRAAQMQTVTKSLDSLVALAKPDGGIYDKIIPYYITSTSISALVEAGRPADQPLIEKARQYLVENMLDEGEGIQKSDFWYGGMGYGGAQRPDRKADIISLEYALQAMKDSALPKDNAAWQKAITFLQRTQNHSETNDQKWAGNDGGFVYYPGFTYHEAGGTTSYGSATYAGVLSYAWADVKKTDPRVQSVLKWVRDNYTVDENPGMGQKTVYYYYMVFAKALQAVGDPVIVDSKGRRHNWREELGAKLLSLQHPEGYWVNTVADEMQDNKVLVTCFTMMAIESILKN